MQFRRATSIRDKTEEREDCIADTSDSVGGGGEEGEEKGESVEERVADAREDSKDVVESKDPSAVEEEAEV